MSHPENEILLKLADPPDCTRCGGPALLHAKFTHSWKNTRGQDVNGLREAVLCSPCDGGARATDGLLALLAGADQMGLPNIQVIGGLAAAWVESVRVPPAFVHRITKYDPADRDEHGSYRGAEEAASDHGPVEAAYLEAISTFAEAAGIDRDGDP
ncbi:DUF6300 family protein [Streptomyces sp. NPDC058371]|uniref:DUF6300 family protein n=1 Tax=Streptomyces sp. NPDC058371 TaxID=3346463 RepID=UPI003664BCFE